MIIPTQEQRAAADERIEDWIAPSQRRSGIYSALANLLAERNTETRARCAELEGALRWLFDNGWLRDPRAAEKARSALGAK